MSIDISLLPSNDDNAPIARGSESAEGSIAASESFFRSKSIFDRIVASGLLCLSAPLIGVLILLVRCTSRGPGIYSQTRVGKDGMIFTMYKLRSMRCDAEAQTGAVWAGVKHDPRMTYVGYWLRRLHLDELPQLVNVIFGHMSLVGPRPERPEFVGLLADEVPGYLDRLRVKPGITGLAQINLPPDTDLDSVRRKLVLDREYIAKACWQMDARIVACTCLRLFGLRGGPIVSWLGLQRTVILTEKGSTANAAEAADETLLDGAAGDSDFDSDAKVTYMAVTEGATIDAAENVSS